MPELGLAFYIGARGTIFSNLICLKTMSKYSHVELVLDFKQRGLSLCFSADEQDGGTRFKYIDLSDPEEWAILTIPVTHEQYIAAWEYARSKNGLKYDWLGILGFVLPFGEHDDNDRFCSEICCEDLQHTLGWYAGVKPWIVSPGMLYSMTEKQLAA